MEELGSPVGGDVLTGFDPGHQPLDGAVISQDFARRAPDIGRLRPFLGGGACTRQLANRTRAGQPHRHRDFADLFPTHLEVAR